MSGTFALLDLPSQALAVQRLLRGRTQEEKLAWISARGKVAPIPTTIPGARQLYSFESHIGLQCLFFFYDEEIVFIGDHTTYTVKDPEE
jgi:hypothetical protein